MKVTNSDNLPSSGLFIWSMKFNQMFKDPGETNEETQEQKTESRGRRSFCIIIITLKTGTRTGCEIGFGNPVMLLG